MGEENGGLWKLVLVLKFSILSDGWTLHPSNARCFGIWRGILSIKDAFDPFIQFRVGSGVRV